jgi:hypothetical protein
MNQLEKHSYLESEIFETPNKLLVTSITYNNGLVSKMFTGIPKGIDPIEIENSLKDSLSTQKNVSSSQSSLYVKGKKGLEMFSQSAKVEYNSENRLLPSGCHLFLTNFGMS